MTVSVNNIGARSRTCAAYQSVRTCCPEQRRGVALARSPAKGAVPARRLAQGFSVRERLLPLLSCHASPQRVPGGPNAFAVADDS